MNSTELALFSTFVVLALVVTVRVVNARMARELAAEQAEPFGEVLAVEIASLLQRGLVIAHRHRDACGMGLRYAEEVFIYDAVHDGELPAPSEVRDLQDRQEFADADSFVRWLSTQTARSLAGHPDVIPEWTRHRLMEAVAFCAKKPPSDWPRYNG